MSDHKPIPADVMERARGLQLGFPHRGPCICAGCENYIAEALQEAEERGYVRGLEDAAGVYHARAYARAKVDALKKVNPVNANE